MEELPAEIRDFLLNQPYLELTQTTQTKKVKCTLNGHEFPCNLTELQKFTSGNKYKKLSASAEFNYSQYEPHVVPSTKQPNHLFCKLTLRHINRVPEHVLRHVNGKRYKKALAYYEECVKQGVTYVPARLRQKRRPKRTDDGMESPAEREHKQKQKQDSGIWAPSSSDEEGGDSEDSMSDLYPSTMFSLKNQEENEEMEEDEDDFQTDKDEDDEMEISVKDEKQAKQKRKKVQSATFTKKLKNNRKKRGFKPVSKVK